MIRFIHFLLSLLLLVACLPVQATAEYDRDAMHVLILNSYHPGNKWSDDIVKGIESSLFADNSNIHLHVEYLDTKNYPLQNFSKLAELYSDKYKSTNIDLIIASDDNAFNFVKNNRGKRLFGAPFVFCGVNYLNSEKLYGLSNATGISETPDLEKTLNLILELHPEVKRIVTVSDMTVSGQAIKRKIGDIRPFYLNKVKLTYWADLSHAELMSRLRGLSVGDIVLFSFFYRDRNGRVISSEEMTRDITNASPVPVYAGWDFSLGYGIVGGKLAGGFSQGKVAGEFAARILGGEEASSIPVVMFSPNQYMFDEEVMRRFDIDQNKLPADSIIINHRPTFLEDHGPIVFSYLTVSSILLWIIVVLGLNIFRCKRAELKLRMSEVRYHDLIELLPQTVFEMDQDWNITYINQFGLKWSGYSREEFLSGNLVKKMIHPDDRARLERNKAEIYQGAPLKGNTYRLIMDDGRVVPVLSYSRRYQREDGRIGLRGILTDVGDLKRAEQEATLVRLSLKNVVNLFPLILIGTDRHGCVNLWNEKAVEVFGIAPEGAQGKPLADIVPAMADEVGMVERTIQSRETVTESRVHKKIAETDQYWDIVSYPLLLEEMETAIIIIDDVTDQVQMERVMVQSEKMMSIGGLAAGMAHEINNPLAAILQNTQVISRRLMPGLSKNVKSAELAGITLEKISDYLDRRGIPPMLDSIMEAGVRVTDIVHDMLSFSRSDDGDETLKETLDIHALIEQALSFARKDHVSYDFKRIGIIKEFDDITQVPCSRSQIQQVLLNILKNGADAMTTWKEMTVDPKFIIRTRSLPNAVRIEIEDNGPGIPEAVQKRIFEPFFTTKDVGVGTGLGLSISYYIITQNHGGTLDIISFPGEGTRFVIDLPC